MEGQRKIRLLLADDSITIRKVVEMTLPPERFQITSVGDGEAALEALANERPDVLLADVIMPKMDGYELCSVVRSSPEFMNIPVILLVGTFENYDELRGQSVGADSHIVKPFETNDLIDKIQEVTTRYKAAAEKPAEVASTGIAEAAAGAETEAALPDTSVSAEVPLEYSDKVEYSCGGEPVDLAAVSHHEKELASFDTLADVPTHHEFCTDENPAPAGAPTAVVTDEILAAVPAERSGDGQEVSIPGEENFPWEEEMDLPEEEAVPAVSAEPVAVEEAPRPTEEHVFSVSDLHPDVVEELEKGLEGPEAVTSESIAEEAISSETAAEALPESVPAEEVTQAEEPLADESCQPEETTETEETVQAEAVCQPAETVQAAEAVQESPAVEAVAEIIPAEEPAPAVSVEGPVGEEPAGGASVAADSLRALQESVEQSVHRAVLSAFGDIFREAVEKAAREVVPGLVEKAVREELERQRG